MRRPGERRISDGRLVGRLLQNVMQAEGLSQAGLARRLGVHPSYISRLLKCRQGTIGERPYLAIREALCPVDRVRFDGAVIGPEQVAALTPYVSWLERELTRYGVARAYLTRRLLEHGIHAHDADVATLKRVRFVGRDEAALRTGEMLTALCGRGSPYTSHFKGFEKWLLRRWSDQPLEAALRGLLAECRVVEPLAAALATGGVERSADELHTSGRLGTYLTAAFKAQRALLDRSVAHRRSSAARPAEARARCPRPRGLGRGNSRDVHQRDPARGS